MRFRRWPVRIRTTRNEPSGIFPETAPTGLTFRMTWWSGWCGFSPSRSLFSNSSGRFRPLFPPHSYYIHPAPREIPVESISVNSATPSRFEVLARIPLTPFGRGRAGANSFSYARARVRGYIADAPIPDGAAVCVRGPDLGIETANYNGSNRATLDVRRRAYLCDWRFAQGDSIFATTHADYSEWVVEWLPEPGGFEPPDHAPVGNRISGVRARAPPIDPRNSYRDRCGRINTADRAATGGDRLRGRPVRFAWATYRRRRARSASRRRP